MSNYNGYNGLHRWEGKKTRAKEINLQDRLEFLEQNLQNNETTHLEYYRENIQRVKTNGIMIRSKAKWVEYGERNSKYFLNLEKRNCNAKYIKKIINSDGTEICNPNQIIDEQVNFYSDPYKSKSKKDTYIQVDEIETFLTNKSIPN